MKILDVTPFDKEHDIVTVERCRTVKVSKSYLWFWERKVWREKNCEERYLVERSQAGNPPHKWFNYPEGDQLHNTDHHFLGLSYRTYLKRLVIEKQMED